MSNENPKVILVDDDKDLLQLIAMRLSASGYAVTAVESGEAALAALSVSRPQVVVTDLRMQGMDGMALFDAIHRDSPSLPVVILTAHGTIPEAVAATRRGVFSFLTKPFEPKVLLDTVAEAMRLSSPILGDIEDWRAELIALLGDGGFAGAGAARCGLGCLGVHLRGERDGEGASCPGDSPGEPARRGALCGGELRGDSGGVVGVGALWAQEGVLYRGGGGPPGAVSGGAGRDAVSEERRVGKEC